MSTALYRRYRPDSFADVIGQEHVTEPLMAALRGERVTHAYLFSGPRGCGKTTSARIFARCLNCASGPTDTPCGTCDSCLELARGGPGSLDVVELDAASHGGVDDARELRERAAFAPARDRYKIFIIDEAHMVTTQGFNALLKLVEEPPEHVKFVFATTEPEKVIGTIRSRTHHYPFRLVPPEQLLDYLRQLAAAEDVTIAPGVLQLVVRAGGGSVRDSLSVLDQLIAGADDGAVTYEGAVALLGFTHATLLDDAAEALAARDGASLFRVVDRVISSGHAPRRFVEDLLERLRDLIVVLAAGDQAASVLRTVPEDQLERMRVQAQHLGLANASRSADLTNLALTEMVGATSPRLQLELLCARLLLPAADDGIDGVNARLERLESGSAARPVLVGEGAVAAAQAPAPPAAEPKPPVREQADQPEERPAAPPVPVAASGPDRTVSPEPEAEPSAELAAQPAATTAGDQGGGLTADQVRRRWPEVLATLAQVKRITWALVQNAQVVDLAGGVLTIGFPTSGLVSTFRTGPHVEPVQRAVAETLGLQARVDAVVADGSTSPLAAAAVPPIDRAAAAAADWARPAQQHQPVVGQNPSSEKQPQRSSSPRSSQPPEHATEDQGQSERDRPPDHNGHNGRAQHSEDRQQRLDRRPPWEDDAPAEDGSTGPEQTVRSEPIPPSARVRAAQAAAATAVSTAVVPDEPRASDPDLEESGLVGAPLVAQMLGGTVIDERDEES